MNELLPSSWKIITLLVNPGIIGNFLSLGVFGSIEKSFKFRQFLPVAIDNSTTVAAHIHCCH